MWCWPSLPTGECGLTTPFTTAPLYLSTTPPGYRRTATSDRPANRTKTEADADPEDAPLRFSTSGAASWRARDTFGGGAEDDVPWYQIPSVLLSTAALLIYFCVLREESDIDERLGGGSAGAMSQVPGLEKQTLQAYIRHQEMAGKSADREKARLREIEQAEVNDANGGAGV